MKYARIIAGLATKLGTSLEKAMEMFYTSKSFEMIDKGISDLHTRSDIYLIDEVAIELSQSK